MAAAPADADPYAVLGIPSNASEAEIRAAFRRVARQYHPDVNPDPAAPERFRAAVAAYETLSDPARRAGYDSRRRSGFGTTGAGSGRAGSARPSGAGAGRPEVRTPWSMPPVRGLDRHSSLRVAQSLLEQGGSTTLDHKRWERCPRCGGFGRLQEEVPCQACGGSGFHAGRLSDPCRVCWTSGTTTVCPDCAGKGWRWRTKHLEIIIPPHSRYGRQLRLRGAGDDGPRGGPPGDLYVELAPPLPPAVQAIASNELVQAALRRLDEWLDRFAPYPNP